MQANKVKENQTNNSIEIASNLCKLKTKRKRIYKHYIKLTNIRVEQINKYSRE